MTEYEFGDVVLIPFPFTDQKTTKRRPAVGRLARQPLFYGEDVRKRFKEQSL